MGKRIRQRPSGRFVLRLDPGLHARLREAAREAQTSLNEFCTRKLAQPTRTEVASGGSHAVVDRACELFGDQLLAVIVYGSWARGEATDTSDVDVLVVVDERASITRSLYRTWDAAPLRWDGRPVEPHFVHLRSDAERASGLWAEAAIEGVVLFERGTRTSERLVRVRREIVAGRLVRRIAHGQPYWAEVA